MPSEKTTAAAPSARPARTRPANRAPTPPGPVAGFPIGPVQRTPKPDLPPHIPPHMAGIITTPRSAQPIASQRAKAQALHPAFGGNDAGKLAQGRVAALKDVACGIASRLAVDVPELEAALTALDVSSNAQLLAELEGLDLMHLAEFTAVLKKAMHMSQPPVPESPQPADTPEVSG